MTESLRQVDHVSDDFPCVLSVGALLGPQGSGGLLELFSSERRSFVIGGRLVASPRRFEIDVLGLDFQSRRLRSRGMTPILPILSPDQPEPHLCGQS